MDYFRENSKRGAEDMELPRILKKNNVEIPGVNKKKSCEISKGLGFWHEILMGITPFCGNFRVKLHSVWNFPCLDFFWNSLMASKSLINT